MSGVKKRRLVKKGKQGERKRAGDDEKENNEARYAGDCRVGRVEIRASARDAGQLDFARGLRSVAASRLARIFDERRRDNRREVNSRAFSRFAASFLARTGAGRRGAVQARAEIPQPILTKKGGFTAGYRSTVVESVYFRRLS